MTGPRPSTGSPSWCPWDCSGPGGASRGVGVPGRGRRLHSGVRHPVVRRHLPSRARRGTLAGRRAGRGPGRAGAGRGVRPRVPVRAAQRRRWSATGRPASSDRRPRTCLRRSPRELRGDVREAARLWDAADRGYDAAMALARLARRGGPARGAATGSRRSGAAPAAAMARRKLRAAGVRARTGRGSSRDPRAPGRADGTRAGGARPARRGAQRRRDRRPSGALAAHRRTTTSPPCWPSSAWPTAARRLPTWRNLGSPSPGMGSRYRSVVPLSFPRFVDVNN